MNSSSSGASYSASLRGNTAIGYANGKFGWGRAQAGPFVVTQVHPTLSGHEAHFGVAQDGSYKAAATYDIGGLLPLDVPYAVNSFNVSVPDAPLGYDWGQSQFSIAPGAATGHSLMVGSDASYTAMGVLLDADGKPISYLQGELSNGKLHTPFFTNKGGRFYVQGVGPGTYTLTVSGKGFEPVSVVIEKTDKRLIELGILHVKREEENRVENP
ncbi:carboxypeptidase-like regulatory domain-containing protein [Enterovibrio coralii]|uniref:carboxypeptidase-like regulatory domain-containing protein n=1 Tax=Enterovibrio coralii TaxID=294935 RepID=UPI0012F8815F|nr:carboxypeptidase-like regulatory domain-containing protein [Enterovibrio coralii]